nr:DUF58 domain-containing protein [Deinobacterium chartae]
MSVQRHHDRYVFAGGRLAVRLELTLHAPLPLWVVLEDLSPRTLIPDRPLRFAGLVWGRCTLHLECHLQANRRGVFEWPPPLLRWADPLGLFWSQRRVGQSTRLSVLPAHHPLLLPDLLRPLLSEGLITPRLGLEDPASLRGVREYRPGDPVNRIHWRQTARHAFSDVPVVRELERVASSGLMVHLDRGGDRVYLESAVRLASSLVHAAAGEQLSVSLSTADGATEMGRSDTAFRAALEVLAAVGPAPDTSGELPLPPYGSNVVILTQHARLPLVEAALRARARAGKVTLVVLPEGFYLEPGESPRPQFSGPPESVRDLERRAGILAEAGIAVFVVRGNQSVLRLAG